MKKIAFVLMATLALVGVSLSHTVPAQAAILPACEGGDESFGIIEGIGYYSCDMGGGGNIYNCVFDLRTGAGYCGD